MRSLKGDGMNTNKFQILYMKVVEAFLDKFQDKYFAQNFYAAMCNTEWEDSEHNIFSLSWRSAGGFVSDIRREFFAMDEDYLDYYCSGIKGDSYNDPLVLEEGIVTEEISQCMESIGLVMISGPEIFDDEYFKDISLC